MMMLHSEIRVAETAEGVVVLQLVGDHDMATAPDLEAHLAVAVAEGRGIVVDFSDTTFADSTVLRVLFRCHEEVEHRGKQLVFQIQPHSPVARILEIAMLGDSVPCVSDRDDAITRALESV